MGRHYRRRCWDFWLSRTEMVRGVIHDGAWGSTLGQAIVCLIAFAILGAIAGWMAEKTIEEAIRNQLLAEIESEQNAKRNVATPQRRS